MLEYVRERYAKEVWLALPQEVARYVNALKERPVLRCSRRICMITHSFYQSDNRVIRYAESLAARGDTVEVIALRARPNQPKKEVAHGVSVVHLQDRFSKDESGPSEHLFRTLRFLFSASTWVTRQQTRRPYDLLHIHNIPDFLVFAAWYPRLRGAKLILDIHDIVPEFFASKYGQKRRLVAIWALKLMERWSAKFAHHLIIANDLWLEKYASRTRSNGKCSVFINNVNRGVFQPGLRTHGGGGPVLIFPGGLQWHQGVDIAIRAMPRVLAALPEAQFHVYGDGNMRTQWLALVADLGLEKCVRFFPALSLREIAVRMANADLGIVPKRADSFGNEAYSTKIMEFMALRVPVVVSDTKVDRYYFDDSLVRFFPSGNAEALAEAVIEVLQNRHETTQRVARAAAYAEAQSWEHRRQDYFKLVDDLCTR
jgi:glycosyltransferase involved in cell wall biosynthesis